MTLGKRAFTLIFPVVLTGYVLAASLLYVSQSASIVGLERARLWQQLGLLGAVFQNDVTQNKSLLYSLVEGSAVRLFINEPDAGYRSNAIGVRIQKSITSLSEDPTRFVSMAILRPPGSVDYYYENSKDPFAEIPAAQIDHARKLIDSPKLSNWSYIEQENGDPLVVHSEFLDPLTLNRPVSSAKAASILLQTAVRPRPFLDMKKALEKEYAADIEISSSPLATEGVLSATVKLGPALYARLTPESGHLDQRLFNLKLLLALGAIGLSLFTIGIVLALVRRYITNPIVRLDRQLTDVMSGARTEIAPSSEAGEIGRLSANMKQLHDEAVESFGLVQTTSWTDTLTAISNREHFNVRSTQILDAARESNASCSLLFIDVDNFKFVNDKHGHKVGDELLKTLASRILAIVKAVADGRELPEILVARLSGDEFAIMVQSQPGDGTINEITTKILDLFSDGFEMVDKSFPVTASIGIAAFPEDAASLPELLASADAAMYQAKAQGKNGSARYSRSLHEKRTRKRRIEEELRTVNPNEEMHLVFMPIVDGHGKVTACEALLRWNSPLLGQVTPDEFIPIAETTGLFSKIDSWVIDRAMSNCGQIKQFFGSETMLCINISSAELYTKSIADRFCDGLERYGLDARSIEIELTETFAVKLGDQSQRNIETLRAKGFRISIDDFGAGYTSVQQIIDYPAETIKLDRELVESLTNGAALPTLRALIALCHAQGMQVVAEGVDTTEKMTLLAAAGCELYQGYLISKPLTAEDLGIWAMQRLMQQAKETTRKTAARAASGA
ncbi:diguanylate cyclase (GGDEF)-like protein [Mycoplana sp. BE70]|uniref:putative bifunctional diguanylate cyclase/phosphodiesterase n=1 Tax=Mycoplana sp. BE70 TaxID=2817775 RepID=UPI00286537D9|nr:EAL domain-containing protein [Mycoplana sp. BE70]MDR6757302.1 diguanylate cyclase (GGDEF)-like protein [Mycoplana sp. BE70]